jgi:membrane fusion protein (multidrug efflux system)
MVLLVGLLAAGGGWFFYARIELFEVAQDARLEVDQEVHPVAAQVAGRVTQARLALARTVQAGEVLVELETQGEQLRVEEERARAAANARRLEALQNEMTAETNAASEEQKAAGLASEEARARYREAEAAARFAEDEAKRLAQLEESKLISKSDSLRAAAEAQQKRSAATALNTAISRQESEAQSKEKNHQVRVAKLKSEAALLEGEIQTIGATIKRYEYEIEKHRIRAPVTGRLGEVASLRAGAFVAEGEKLAAIIPTGQLKAVAHFPPHSALGRIRPGQPAWLRLDGFPWTQYGKLAGQVASVATEPRDGSIRVDLTVDPQSAPLIPVQHGLTGTSEVSVDRVTPAALVLRAVGKLLSAPGPTIGFRREREGGRP